MIRIPIKKNVVLFQSDNNDFSMKFIESMTITNPSSNEVDKNFSVYSSLESENRSDPSNPFLRSLESTTCATSQLDELNTWNSNSSDDETSQPSPCCFDKSPYSAVSPSPFSGDDDASSTNQTDNDTPHILIEMNTMAKEFSQQLLDGCHPQSLSEISNPNLTLNINSFLSLPFSESSSSLLLNPEDLMEKEILDYLTFCFEEN